MKLYVVSHRHQEFPGLTSIYQPLYVGATNLMELERRDDWEYDDSFHGNISKKNASFCELTGLYWMWKCSREDIVGLVHYRRFFKSPSSMTPSPLNEEDINDILSQHDAVVARKVYYSKRGDISTARQYRIAHCSTDIVQLRLIIKRHEPSYLDAFDEVMTSTGIHPYNTIVCKKELLDKYAKWLFRVEHRLEQRIDAGTNRNRYQQRVFGFLAERLLNVWILHQRLDVQEADVYNPFNSENPIDFGYTNCPHQHVEHFQSSNIPRTTLFNGIDYSPVFDPYFYLDNYPDLREHYSNNPAGALEHFVAHGIGEYRMAHPHFSIASYINGNPKLREQLGDNPHSYIVYYLAHPEDNRHVVGYENLHVAESCVNEKPNTMIDRLRNRRQKHFEKIAESLPVID